MSFQEKLQAYNTAKQQLKDEFKPHFMAELKNFFNNNPGLVGISWPQYTPYFNDGDPCEFGVHESELKYSDMEEYENYYDLEDETRRKTCQQVTAFIQGFHDDLLEDLFGEGEVIVIMEDGKLVIEVEDYDHD